jgi:hypothetical protein
MLSSGGLRRIGRGHACLAPEDRRALRAVRFGAVACIQIGWHALLSWEVHLGSIAPSDVRVEILADTPGGPAVSRDNGSRRERSWLEGRVCYTGAVPGDCPPADYTPRVLASRDGVQVPLEVNFITWQK